jgi:homospermidine synthase
MTDEIIDGRDVLGLTYYLENGEVFWIGSTLGIDEARKLFDSEFNDYVNATNT